MLKVVGASWEQTRLTSILLISVVITALITILFFEVPFNTDDGIYAATATYRHRTGFNVQFWGQNNNPSKVKKGIARAYYKPTIKKTGWASIEIETQAKYPDWAQAYSAGLLEGSLTWQLIYTRWMSTIGSYCKNNQEICDTIRADLKAIETIAKANGKLSENLDPYWHQINLYYTQLDGLEDGWKLGVSRSRKQKQLKIQHEDFLWMTSANDIKSLEELKHKKTNEFKISKSYVSLALLKLLPNSTLQFMLAHESGESFSELLRMQKKYTFGFHKTASNTSELINGETIIFTSYPGAIYSLDDFYQVSGNTSLTISGTTLKMKNQELLKKVDLSKVLIGPRVMAACRLSEGGNNWAELISRDGSGTGGKQWLVVDNKEPLSLWVVEQGPSISVSSDETDILEVQGYWISTGIPYFQETRNIFGYENETDSVIEETVTLLKTGITNVTTPDGFLKFMHKPQLIALGRPDIIQYADDRHLEPKNGGVIDLKIAIGNKDYIAIAGPLHSSEVPPFQWSNSILQFLPHYGQPDLWKFEPVKPPWVW